MADIVTLDVIDRPRGGALRSLRSLRREAAATRPGRRTLIPLTTLPFSDRLLPPPATPRRIGVLGVWEPDADRSAAAWSAELHRRLGASGERWHVTGQLTRAMFTEPWLGWDPQCQDAEPLRADEPALILISGDIKPRHIWPFVRDNLGAVRRAFESPGYLGGLGIQSRLLNTTSVSAWATYADARTYAYKPGGHATAMKNDLAAERHATKWFIRIRPLVSHGTVAGQAPFAGLVAERPALATV